MEIVSRYFISSYNSVDTTTVPPKTKEEPIDKTYHYEEVKALLQDLTMLLDNPFYIGLLKKYPETAMIKLSLRREIILLENSDKVSLNTDNINVFYKAFDKLKEELPEKYKQSETFKELDEVSKGLKTAVNKKSQR